MKQVCWDHSWSNEQKSWCKQCNRIWIYDKIIDCHRTKVVHQWTISPLDHGALQ